MALSKTEVNLRRLLATAPQQQNQVKLIHYVATLRDQLEQSAAEKTSEGLLRVSKAQSNEYSEKIEGIAAKLRNTESNRQVSQDRPLETSDTQILSKPEEESVHSPRGLRRRPLRPVPPTEDRSNDTVKVDHKVKSVKLDSAAHTHIEKHRNWCAGEQN